MVEDRAEDEREVIPMRSNIRKWRSEEDQQLAELRAMGMKWSVVAKKLKKTESATVARACILGIPKLGGPVRRATEPVGKNRTLK